MPELVSRGQSLVRPSSGVTPPHSASALPPSPVGIAPSSGQRWVQKTAPDAAGARKLEASRRHQILGNPGEETPQSCRERYYRLKPLIAAQVVDQLARIVGDDSVQDFSQLAQLDTYDDFSTVAAIHLADQLVSGQRDDVFENFLKNRQNIGVADVVPGKWGWFDRGVTRLQHLTPLNVTGLLISEKFVKGGNALTGTTLNQVGTVTPLSTQCLRAAGLCGGTLGLINSTSEVVAQQLAPEADRFPQVIGVGETEADRFSDTLKNVWDHHLTLPAKFLIDSSIIVGSTVLNPTVGLVSHTVINSSAAFLGTKLLIDGVNGTVRQHQSEPDEHKLRALLSNPAIASVVGACLLSGSVMVMTTGPAGYFAIGSGLVVAGGNLFVRQVMDYLDKKAREAAVPVRIGEKERLTLKRMKSDPRTRSVFRPGFIDEREVAVQLDYYGVRDRAMISNRELAFIEANIANYDRAVAGAETTGDAQRAFAEVRHEIGEYLISAAILKKIHKFSAIGTPRALKVKNKLVETRLYHNLGQGMIVDESVREQLLLAAIRRVYQSLPLDRATLMASDVRINELLAPLQGLSRSGDRPIPSDTAGKTPVLLSEFNIQCKQAYLEERRDYLHAAVVGGNKVAPDVIITAEQILKQVSTGKVQL